MDDIFESDLPKIKTKRTRSDSLRDFIDLSRREDELHMWGRLFEGLEESVKCSSREHMYFIDDVNLIFTLIRLESCPLYELTDILDSIVRCSIDFYNI